MLQLLLATALAVLTLQGRGVVDAAEPPAEGPNTSFVAYNRYSIFGVSDQGSEWQHPNPLVKTKINGAFPIQSSNHQISHRFTLPAGFNQGRQVDALWLYYRTVGDPGPLSVALRETDPLSPLQAAHKSLAPLAMTRPTRNAPLAARWATIPYRVPSASYTVVTPRRSNGGAWICWIRAAMSRS